MRYHSIHHASQAQATTLTAHTARPTSLRHMSGTTRRLTQIALFLMTVVLLTGCASAQSVSSDSTFSISALETALQEEGVFVMPRGPANLDIPADQSSRLVLNSSEVLNVFEFDSIEQAQKHAFAFAGAHPRHDVYHKQTIVAVRQTSGATGLSNTLRRILGEAL